MGFKRTARGFAINEFRDYYNEECSIQKSSQACVDCVWLGIDEPKIIDGEPYGRMLLDKKMARRLSTILRYFADNGELPASFAEAKRYEAQAGKDV